MALGRAAGERRERIGGRGPQRHDPEGVAPLRPGDEVAHVEGEAVRRRDQGDALVVDAGDGAGQGTVGPLGLQPHGEAAILVGARASVVGAAVADLGGGEGQAHLPGGRRRDVDAVAALAEIDLVGTVGADVEQGGVVARAAGDGVVAETAAQHVVAEAADQGVVAAAPVDDVVAREPVQRLAGIGADQVVVAGGHRRGAEAGGPQQVVAELGLVRVGAPAADHLTLRVGEGVGLVGELLELGRSGACGEERNDLVRVAAREEQALRHAVAVPVGLDRLVGNGGPLGTEEQVVVVGGDDEQGVLEGRPARRRVDVVDDRLHRVVEVDVFLDHPTAIVRVHGAIDGAALDHQVETVRIGVQLVEGGERQLGQRGRGFEARHAEGDLGAVRRRLPRAVEVAAGERLRDHRQALGRRRAGAGGLDRGAVLQQVPARPVLRAVGVGLQAVPEVGADPGVVRRGAQAPVIVVIRVAGAGDHVERAAPEHLPGDLVGVRAGDVVGAARRRGRRVAELHGGDDTGRLALLLGEFRDREQVRAVAVDVDGVVVGLAAGGDGRGGVARIGIGIAVPLVAREGAGLAIRVEARYAGEIVVLGRVVDHSRVLGEAGLAGNGCGAVVERVDRLRGGGEAGSVGNQHLAGRARPRIAVRETVQVKTGCLECIEARTVCDHHDHIFDGTGSRGHFHLQRFYCHSCRQPDACSPGRAFRASATRLRSFAGMR